MSRIGRKPITVPSTVQINLNGSKLSVKGPKGELSRDLPAPISAAFDNGEIVVTRPDDTKRNKALHGLTRALIQNMVIGVTEGYQKTLKLVGVGYRAEVKGSVLILNVGFSHPIVFSTLPELTISSKPKENTITIEGIDKQLVGEAAAKIRAVRPPEPYKGKGIKYIDEYIKRKAGKTAGA
ncbi:MAG: 50S ribosomal protein L6 [candidate division Zixibacteria bacterium]|nr:50S ribosomal protein L6 [candidate division Zixibacteria bacterium]